MNTKNQNAKNVKNVNNNVNVEKLTDLDLLNLNLDEVNVYDLIEKNQALKVQLSKRKDKKESIYKKDIQNENESDKNFRQRIRKIRNGYLDNVINAVNTKDTKNIETSLNSFISFYKDTYLLNDFSINSLSRNNADKNTLAKIKIVLHLAKNLKTK